MGSFQLSSAGLFSFARLCLTSGMVDVEARGDAVGGGACCDVDRFLLPDGRGLAFAQYGDPCGHPVFSFHGGLSCRVEMRFSDELCRVRGVRLVAVDRPGIGASEFQPGRRLVDWPGDVARLADHLGLDRFAVLGWSAGGPYALACARFLGSRLTGVACMAAMAPLDAPASLAELGLLADRILFPLAARSVRAAALLLSLSRLAPCWALRHWMVKALVDSGDPDAIELAALPPRELTDFYVEALAHGAYGTAWDYRLLGGDWGFALEEIRVPVFLWHGMADGLVPISHAERLAAALPDGRFRPVAGRGHFLPRLHLDAVLSELVEPIETAVGDTG